jgi:hypothetical protein
MLRISYIFLLLCKQISVIEEAHLEREIDYWDLYFWIMNTFATQKYLGCLQMLQFRVQSIIMVVYKRRITGAEISHSKSCFFT